MTTQPINFTVTHAEYSNDQTDETGDIGTAPLMGLVEFIPQFPAGAAALAPDATPPAAYTPRTFTGYVDTDGVLKNKPSGTPGVRLWANDPMFGLTKLPYKVKFHLTDSIGRSVTRLGGILMAPTTDTSVPLSSFLPIPSATASGLALGPAGRSIASYTDLGAGLVQWLDQDGNPVGAPYEIAVDYPLGLDDNGDGTADGAPGTGGPGDGEPVIDAGTTGQYWRGDKTWQTLNQDAVPDGTTNKAYSAADKSKLSGIAANATNVVVATDVPAMVHAATAKTTLATSDEILLLDSAAAFGAKKILPTVLASELAARMNLAQIKLAPLASGASTLTLTTAQSHFIHTGSGATWTLPAVSGNTNSRLVLQNLGSGSVTVQRATTDQIWKASALTLFPLSTNSTVTIWDNGSYWVVEAIPAAMLNIPGTPDGTKFLRDDGTWATVIGGGGTASSFKTIADYASISTSGGDWSTAINAMLADTHGNSAGVGGDGGYAVLPPGKGVWSGTALGQVNTTLIGQSSWHTMLTLSTSLINDVSGVGVIRIENMALFGGTNPITITTATDNGGRFRMVKNVEFHGYSGTALRVTGSDTPYFHFENLTFDGAANSTGMSMAGFTDNVVMHHLEFRSYKVGLRLGGVMQRMEVSACNFMHVSETSSAPRYDVMITPSPYSGGLASGIGVDFSSMWHGSEGRASNDRFIIVADDNGSGLPVTGSDSTGYFCGVVFEKIGAFYVADGVPYVDFYMDMSHVQSCDIGDKARRYTPSAYTTSPMIKSRSGAMPDSSNTIHLWMDGFTKNRRNPKTAAVTNVTSWTIDSDAFDYVENTGLTGAVTVNAPTGTPKTSQKLWVVLQGTASRAITWNAAFEASTISLPTTTSGTARLDVGFVWNPATSKFRCVAAA